MLIVSYQLCKFKAGKIVHVQSNGIMLDTDQIYHLFLFSAFCFHVDHLQMHSRTASSLFFFFMRK